MGCGVGGGTFKGCEFEYFKALRPETKVELPEKKKTIVLHSMKMKKSCPIDNDNLHFINVKLLSFEKNPPSQPSWHVHYECPKLGKSNKRLQLTLERVIHKLR